MGCRKKVSPLISCLNVDEMTLFLDTIQTTEVNWDTASAKMNQTHSCFLVALVMEFVLFKSVQEVV